MQGTTAPTRIILLSSLVSAFIGFLLGLRSLWSGVVLSATEGHK